MSEVQETQVEQPVVEQAPAAKPKPKPKARKAKPAKKKLGTQSPLKESGAKKLTKGFYKPGDPLAIRNKDNRFVYRWISTKKAIENGGVDPRGWEIDKTLGNSGAKASSEPFLDGTQRCGDLVLAKMPVEQAEARRAFYAKKQRQRDEIIGVKSKTQGLVKADFQSQRGGRVVEKIGD